MGSVTAGLFVANKFEQIMVTVMARFLILAVQIIDNHSSMALFRHQAVWYAASSLNSMLMMYNIVSIVHLTASRSEDKNKKNAGFVLLLAIVMSNAYGYLLSNLGLD